MGIGGIARLRPSANDRHSVVQDAPMAKYGVAAPSDQDCLAVGVALTMRRRQFSAETPSESQARQFLFLRPIGSPEFLFEIVIILAPVTGEAQRRSSGLASGLNVIRIAADDPANLKRAQYWRPGNKRGSENGGTAQPIGRPTYGMIAPSPHAIPAVAYRRPFTRPFAS